MGNAEHKDGLQEKGRKKKFVSEKGYQSITEVRSGLQDKNKGEVFTMTSLFLYKNKISTNKKPYRPFERSDITSRCPPPTKMGNFDETCFVIRINGPNRRQRIRCL